MLGRYLLTAVSLPAADGWREAASNFGGGFVGRAAVERARPGSHRE